MASRNRRLASVFLAAIVAGAFTSCGGGRVGWIFAALNDADKDLIVRLETGSGTVGWLVPHFDDLWQMVQSEGPPELPRTIIVIDPDGCLELFRDEVPAVSSIVTITQLLGARPEVTVSVKQNLSPDEVVLEPNDACASQ